MITKMGGLSKATVRRQSILKRFETREYTGNHCFYCGKKLRSRTDEHVFPLWLQRRFELQNQMIYLLNGTAIKCSQLKVPCCRKCNNEHLSGLEKRVGRHLRLAPDKLTAKNLTDIFTWACKILLGIIYKERLLPNDRRHQRGDRILPKQLHNAFAMTHLLVQNAHLEIDFSAEGKKRIPGSVFVFKVQSPEEVKMQFDFRDDIFRLAVFLRGTFFVKMAALIFILCNSRNWVRFRSIRQSYSTELQRS